MMDMTEAKILAEKHKQWGFTQDDAEAYGFKVVEEGKSMAIYDIETGQEIGTLSIDQLSECLAKDIPLKEALMAN